MPNDEIISKMIESSPNRRSFVQKLGLAGAALGAGAVALTSGRANAQSSTAITDADILNFALNLEYLEAEFYTVATTGQTIDKMGISITGTGTAGTTTGGAIVPFSTSDSTANRVALELAADERTHVTLLRTALAGLGAQPVAKPAINLTALGFGFQTQMQFLTLARIFEDIGVTAYGGAAPLIQNNAILGYAARILATEALHSGNIRSMIDRYSISTSPALDPADHLPPPSGTQFFPTDTNAITEVRTPGQVLYLAYNGANLTSGGFFPGGVNGKLNTSAANSARSDGTFLMASPNPAPITTAQPYGITTITWNAPAASEINVRVGSPTGALFTDNANSGSMLTNAWVVEGEVLYLQDVSNGKPLTAANTLATLTLHTVMM